MSFQDMLPGAVVMAPMTKGSNLPYRQLCVELGARVLVSEMAVARRLKQKRRGEYALIRRAPDEPCFGVQLAGNRPDELAWAAALVESRGAEFVDLNLGCPIDHFTRKGLGAALARQPNRVRRNVEAMRLAVSVPVTVKIRLGWNAEHRNYLDVAKAAVDGGAAAITVHGRTREARYRHPADWDTIAEVARALPVPVIGNGDLLFAHEIRERLATSGCAAVMSARGVLIKPWIFREAATDTYWDISATERLGLYRRYVTLARAHWEGDGALFHRSAREGDRADEGERPSELCPPTTPIGGKGLRPLRQFLNWHVGFWVRYVPRRSDGTWPTMQGRESSFEPRSPLEALLARSDQAAIDYITDQLLEDGELTDPPAVSASNERSRDDRNLEVEAG